MCNSIFESLFLTLFFRKCYGHLGTFVTLLSCHLTHYFYLGSPVNPIVSPFRFLSVYQFLFREGRLQKLSRGLWKKENSITCASCSIDLAIPYCLVYPGNGIVVRCLDQWLGFASSPPPQTFHHSPRIALRLEIPAGTTHPGWKVESLFKGGGCPYASCLVSATCRSGITLVSAERPYHWASTPPPSLSWCCCARDGCASS